MPQWWKEKSPRSELSVRKFCLPVPGMLQFQNQTQLIILRKNPFQGRKSQCFFENPYSIYSPFFPKHCYLKQLTKKLLGVTHVYGGNGDSVWMEDLNIRRL